jgi:hypothetical protein
MITVHLTAQFKLFSKTGADVEYYMTVQEMLLTKLRYFSLGGFMKPTGVM